MNNKGKSTPSELSLIKRYLVPNGNAIIYYNGKYFCTIYKKNNIMQIPMKDFNTQCTLKDKLNS